MSRTDVAIIGLACRLPGAAGPRDFWRLVRDGREETRLPGDIAEFDADFFNLSPREATAMDPRQRVALELAWELFEDAFLVPETLRGEQVSIFLGAMTDDYAVLTLRDGADNLDHHSFGGVSRAMIANRISYAFGLQGSSMIVDSGQSSSLVAVHLACESLGVGESQLAIAGGIHLNLADETAMLETEFGAMSTSGHTYAFDGRADGYVRAEGAGMVLLKPLTAAIRDGNRIRAVIRGSAVGNAGHSSAGQTVPSVPGQADVIRRALDRAGLGADDIDYIEAHGTGTEVGDPVEARALGEIFATRQDPVLVGSVKTNIGHTGSAAGIAGLLKAVLAVENAEIPPSLNYDSAASGNDMKSRGLQVNTALEAWPNQGRPRRAGVSSFGMGGTNAHVILEEAPAQPDSVVAEPQRVTPLPWVLSARSEQALTNQAARLAAHLAADDESTATDVAWSLATTRSTFEHRAVLVGSQRQSLTAGLTRLAAGEPGAVAGRARASGKTVFVFPGQGSQWPGMGRQLHERFPVFARAFDEAVDALDAQLRSGLRDVIWGLDPQLLVNTEFAQPALFAIEVALAALLQSWGTDPDLVMGHSVGEITAAHIAGVLTLDDAARLVAVRGRLMAGLPAGGAMIAVGAGEDDVTPLLADGVAIAAVNAQHSVVLSGAEPQVGAVADRLARHGARVHRLAVSHAFHSVLVEPMIDEFARLISDIKADQPRIGLVSNVTGQLADADYGSAQYWAEHVRRPVRFADGVRLAESLGAKVFAEVGPAAGLSAAVEQSLNTEHAAAVPTLVTDRPEIDTLLTAAGQLFAHGATVDWPSVLHGLGGRRVELPTYGFARQRFWLGLRAEAPAPLLDRAADLAERLQALTPEDQRRHLVELVCTHAATVLGHPSSRDIDVERAFSEIGFESLTGVELRNRLKAATGLALSRTLIFDFPTPLALAEQLRHQLLHDDRGESDDEKTWRALRKIPLRELRRTGLLDKLLLLAGESELVAPAIDDDVIDSLSPDALIAMALESDDVDDAE
ncbi:polyketide synthase [Mycobacterium florentinum]|uniref:Polyketide synthase n=1 Tax=Mycobacterium florentinum TaxID=292462 RepID=A0A1X1TW28_MYCFL|nr:type I polyketide synthase [Mycobacterium florentinum]MCV7408097.1 acyltransferase domain-containing protein [Mycobacterium florentinum]ORV48792.1 polyketide synthase [Mycobacterium florentinum]BBX77127.1 polyketide synthase [Mycobacterium florentinum]